MGATIVWVINEPNIKRHRSNHLVVSHVPRRVCTSSHHRLWLVLCSDRVKEHRHVTYRGDQLLGHTWPDVNGNQPASIFQLTMGFTARNYSCASCTMETLWLGRRCKDVSQTWINCWRAIVNNRNLIHCAWLLANQSKRSPNLLKLWSCTKTHWICLIKSDSWSWLDDK